MPVPKTELGYFPNDGWDFLIVWHKMFEGWPENPIQAFPGARTGGGRNLGCFVPKISCPDFLIVQ